MSKPRFFIDAELNPVLKLTLPQNVSHHLLTVLRLKPGDSIIAFNGRGGEFHGVLETISKKSAIVNLMTYDDVSRAASIEVNLGLCVLKRDAMDRVSGLGNLPHRVCCSFNGWWRKWSQHHLQPR